MGFLGIREPTTTKVPGTVHLNEHWSLGGGQGISTHPGVSNAKHGSGKNAHIVLVPQPTHDPNDPLNWHPLRKLSITLIVGLGSCIYAASYGHLFDAGTVVLAMTMHRPIPDIVKTSGYQLLAAGAVGPFVSACAHKWGKRPVFIASSLLGLLGSIVGAATNSYEGLLAARLIQGFSMPAYESIVGSMIGDMYFVHQRGMFIGIVGFVLAVVANIAPVVCGPVTDNLGWKYLFYLCIPITAFQTIMLILFVPETQYRRKTVITMSSGSESDEPTSEASESEKHARVRDVETGSDTSPVPPQAKSFWQDMALFTGSYSDGNFLQLLLAPFAVCLNVAIFWSVLLSGYLTATYVAQAYVIAQIFAPPPYLLQAAGIGYLFLGPFVGGVLATALFAVTMDPLVKWCSQRNRGVYEPEYRLIWVLGGLLVGVGLFGWGAVVQQGASVYGAAALHGVVMFGIVVANDALYTYALDAFQDVSSEIFVVSCMIKNFVFFGFSYFVSSWTATAGPEHVFNVFGGLAVGLVASGALVFFFGKRYRAYWASNNLMEKLQLTGHAEI